MLHVTAEENEDKLEHLVESRISNQKSNTKIHECLLKNEKKFSTSPTKTKQKVRKWLQAKHNVIHKFKIHIRSTLDLKVCAPLTSRHSILH